MRVLPDRLVAILFSLAIALLTPAAPAAAQSATSPEPAISAPAAEPSAATEQVAPAAEPSTAAPEPPAPNSEPAPTPEPTAPAPESPAPAPALTGLAAALAHFLEDDFSETDTGIAEVAASGDPRAITIIEALQDGRLSYSAEQKKVFYKDKAGKLIDAVTGAPVEGAEPADLGNVRVNNRVRRALDAALGGLSLQAADPGKRFESAQAVF